MRCFFKDVRGVGLCAGMVTAATGDGRYPMMNKTSGYCEHHRHANMERGFWGASVRSARSLAKSKLDAVAQAIKAA